MEKAKILDLAYKYINGNATADEQRELHAWYDEKEIDEEQVVVTENPETMESIRARMLAKLIEEIESQGQPSAKVVPMRKANKWYWAAAAVAVTLLGLAIYVGTTRKQEPAGMAENKGLKNDIPPGGNKAILQLADGTTIILDSAANGKLADQGATSIVKTNDGEITYNSGTSSVAALYNSITTPVGGQYQVTLPDGSKVWLNAMSSLRFPAAFNGKERRVELTGEAYFEVAKNAAQPFRVAIGNATTAANYCEVEVLGTHFNIKAYNDEALLKTSLLEGKIRLTLPAKNISQIMDPGQQTQVNSTGALLMVKNADLDEVVAWHNGLFRFKEVSIEEIMLQANRWYGVDVVYEGKIDEHFVSTIPRQSTLQEFFRILEKTGRVHFKMDGKKVTVTK